MAQNGSVIVLQTKGVVEAISPQGVKLKEPVVRGSVLPVGYAINTGLFSESILLFSNGTTATVLEKSQIKLTQFKQLPFEAQGNSFGQLTAEPSTSQVSINMDVGSLVVQTKKLNKSSSFSISTPTGTAGIRGTQFQMAMSPNTGMKLDVAESQVAFTPAGQNQPVLVGPGRGLDASASGTINQRPISPSAAQNISVKNASAASVCDAVPVATSQEASAQAEKSTQEQDNNGETDEENQDSSDSEEDGEQEKQAQSSSSEAAESFLGRSSSVTQRSISAAEIQRIQKETLEKLASSAYGDSSMPPPPNVQPPGPPSESPSIGNSVRYDFDVAENLLSIGLYQDGIPVPVEVSFLNLDDLSDEDDFALILSQFQNWNTDDETKLINAIGLDVFIDEIGLNPYKYDDFNVAVQHAINLAGSFLKEVTIASVIPSDNVWNAQGLADQFSNNPYAFEFAKLLAKHGAISNPSNQAATDNLLAILGSDKLSDSNYLSSLLDQTIYPGGTYNSEELNGGLIGARNASIDADTADQLQVRLDHVNALVGGDIFIESGAIDFSQYLPKKGASDGTKIFTIAAAKDLSIWGDVTFENNNHAEDHALALGAAGNLNVQAGSKIYYEGSNLGLGTAGDLKLVDVDIDVGGNLAIGSLGDLDIEFTEPGSKLFSVGRYSDRDNVYLYANDLITAQGLWFNDRAREIYMEAITINLKDVNFPEQSEVMLRSQAGTIDFGTFDSPTIGGVNLTNVKHLGISTDRALQQTDFSGSSGKWNSTATQANGTPAVRVRAFSGANSGSGVN
ncbi:MAG: FecR domain-containing protein [Opitutae bacterium]